MAFVKVDRALLEWEWFSDSNTMHVLLYLSLTANWKQGRWRGIEVGPGSTVTSRAKIAEAIKLTEKQVRLALDRLEQGRMIVREKAGKGQLITLASTHILLGDTEPEGRIRAGNKAGKRPDEGRMRAGLGPDEGRMRATIEEEKEEEEGKERKEGEEETTTVVSRKAPDERITVLFDHLKSTNGGLLDGSVQRNRQACHTMIQRMAKEYPERDPVEVVRQLIDIAKLDDFHGPNLTSFDYLVRHGSKIINSFKAKRNGAAGQTREQINQSIDRIVAERYGV
jgi:hypothetical protein